MSDPRRRIAEHRAMLVGSLTSDRSVGGDPTPGRTDLTAPTPMIGKKQGRLRSVGLYLSADDAQHLRNRAGSQGIALGIALVQLMNRTLECLFTQPPGQASCDPIPIAARRTTRRGLDRPSIVYVLLDPSEASAIKAAADTARISVSDLAARCIATDAARSAHDHRQ